MGEYTIAISNILNEHQITNLGANVGLYIAFLLIGVGYSYLGIRFSGYLNKFMVFWVLIGSTVIIVAMPALAPNHPSAEWVFTEFQNSTGYKNSGLAFFLGLLQAGWTLVGYENGAQIAEGTKNADMTGPRGIIISVVGAIVQALILCISTLFSIQDLDELLESSFPLGTLFVRAAGPKLAAFFLVIVCVAQFASLCNTLFTVSQLIWSMSRDKCIPNHKFWYKLSERYQMPVRILLLVALFCIVVIMPSLASEVYWTAMLSTAVICLNLAYGLPYFCRLIWKRDLKLNGPFNLGRFSLVINFFAVSWIAFFGVILCIPSVHPVGPVTMNWSSLMIGAIMIFALTFWYISGRKNFKGPIQTLGSDSH
ncbi:amino acid/polyamine transporter I [Phascolomyces articulosus]|uniref:Amino acid/polyamine transporter I n=1 Tax=Phascolomyces articulosus TaxID=60185 RepID=A0AAD5KLD9_9FUNG|nr:amino acid/polyamine transporter I [Phascolomyces articulosus]